MPRPSPLCAATVSGERYSAFHDACFDGRVTHLTTDKAGARLPPSLRQLFSFMWLFTLDLVPENSADSAFISEPLHFAITSHGFLYGPHLAVRTVISPLSAPTPEILAGCDAGPRPKEGKVTGHFLKAHIWRKQQKINY